MKVCFYSEGLQNLVSLSFDVQALRTEGKSKVKLPFAKLGTRGSVPEQEEGEREGGGSPKY